jgi:hypothetical protein
MQKIGSMMISVTHTKTILNVVTNKEGKLFFVYGSGGTNKTFVWTTLLSPLRGQGKIVLAVASSGIASLLLLGGRTAHSRFKILIDLHDESTCNITQQMKVAKLVCKADLIIWDEAPMMHRRTFEAIDRTLRDLMQLDDAQATENSLVGKPWSLVGIFDRSCLLLPRGDEKTLLVLPCFDRIFGSMLTILHFRINMRVMAANSEEQREFAKWVLNVGDGSLPAIAEEEGVDPDWIKDSIPYEAASRRLQLKRINPNHLSGSLVPLWRCHVSYAT